MSKPSLKGFLEFLKSEMEEDSTDYVDVKTIQIKKEWRPALEKLVVAKERGKALIKQLEELKREANLLDDAFWSMVRLSDKELMNADQLHYDVEKNEIVVRMERGNN